MSYRLSYMGVLIPIAACFLLACPVEGRAEEETPQSTAGWTLPLDGPGTGEVIKIWQNCVHFYSAGKYSDLLVELDKLKQARLDAGIRNLTSVSSALIFMSGRIADRSSADYDVALDVSKYATALSPEVPDFYFLRSNMVWSFDKGQVGEYAGEYFLGLKATFKFLPSLHGFLLGGTGIVWLVGLVVMMLYSVILLYRRLALFAHDAGHLLPRSLSRIQLNLIGLILMFVPFLVDLGLVPLFALWWVCLWAYQSKHERIVTVIMILFVYLWPIMNSVFTNSVTFSTSAAEKSYACFYQPCGTGALHDLQREVDSGNDDGTALYALASAHFRGAMTSTNELETAQVLYRQGSRAVSGELQRDFLTGLGNVYFVQGMKRCNRSRGKIDAGLDEFQDARKHYDKALDIDPRYWPAHYNRARVLSLLAVDEDADHALLTAKHLGPEQVAALERSSVVQKKDECSETFNANRELALPALQLPLLREGRGDDDESAAYTRLPAGHALLIGPLEVWMLSLLATGVLLCIIGLTVLGRWMRPSTRCLKCGEISCVRCRPELSGTGLCNQCVYYKIRSSYVDPKETWLREKRIENRHRARRKVEALLTFILPGAGHMLRGRPVRGVIFMTLMGSALAGIFLFQPIVGLAAWPTMTLAQTSVVGTAFWSLVAFVVYFLSLLDIHSWR